MENNNAPLHYDVAIIGGGLAGLITAIELSTAGLQVVLFEKKEYPYHKVCGEYVSMEVLPYLQSLGFNPFDYGATSINKLRVTTPKGQSINSRLPLGGFGISRYTMDAALANLAVQRGTDLFTGTRVSSVSRALEKHFLIITDARRTYTADMVIGSWGKRDMLDKKLERPFMDAQTGFMGVKYHIKGPFPDNEISLHLFPGGYCGLTKIENDIYNLCYLYKRDKSKSKSLEESEKRAHENPELKKILSTAQLVRPAPEVINEISFAKKETSKDGVLMCGDAAGLITPLCGNGMAMAIRSSRLLSECILNNRGTLHSNGSLHSTYARKWNKAFSSRLAWGRALQNIFYNPVLVAASLGLLNTVPPLQKWLIRKTHGKVMN